MPAKRVILNENEVIKKYKKLNSISKTAYSFRANEARVREILIKYGYLRKVEGKRLYEKVREVHE